MFERKRIPNDIRIFGIAIYIQTLSTKRTAKILSEFHSVSHTKEKNLIAIDETDLSLKKF